MGKHVIYWRDKKLDSLSPKEIDDAITSLRYLERSLGNHGFYNGRKIWEWKLVFEDKKAGRKILVPKSKLRYNILYIYSCLIVDDIMNNPAGHKFDTFHKIEKLTL